MAKNKKRNKLKSLEKHNAEARERHSVMNDNSPRLNGIACPECGAELYDTNPNITLTSWPGQKNVHCGQCEYVGYRVA